MAVDTRPGSVPSDAGHDGGDERGRLPLWMTAVGAALLAIGFRLGQHVGSYAHPGEGVAKRAPRPASVERPGRRWKDILLRVYHKVGTDRMIALAAGVTFYSILALFPAIAALVSLYGLFADPAIIASHLDSLAGVLPGGAVDIIGDELRRLTARQNGTLGLTFVVGLATALWSANAGMKSLFDALNLVFDEPEKRGLIRLNAVSLAFTTATIGFVLVALAAMVVLPIALDEFGIAALADQLIRWLRWPALLLAVMLGLALLYRFGPSHTQPRWRWITRGSAIAAALWLIASVLFTWYAANFGSYDKTYGSLGAVIGFMMWIWISTMVMLLGAELDAAMEHRSVRHTSSAPAAE